MHLAGLFAHAEGWRCWKEIRGEHLDGSQESQRALQQQALERQSDGGNSVINTAWACGGLCLGLWSHMCKRNQPHSRLRSRQKQLAARVLKWEWGLFTSLNTSGFKARLRCCFSSILVVDSDCVGGILALVKTTLIPTFILHMHL